MNLSQLLKDTNYQLTQFSTEHITLLENTIFQKPSKKWRCTLCALLDTQKGH